MKLFLNDTKFLDNKAYLEFHQDTSAKKALKPFAESIESALAQLCKWIEDAAHFSYEELPGSATVEELRKRYQDFFQVLNQRCDALKGELPPALTPILLFEDQVFQKTFQENQTFKSFSDELLYTIQFHFDRLEGYVYWLVLIQKDLQKLK